MVCTSERATLVSFPILNSWMIHFANLRKYKSTESVTTLPGIRENNFKPSLLLWIMFLLWKDLVNLKHLDKMYLVWAFLQSITAVYDYFNNNWAIRQVECWQKENLMDKAGITLYFSYWQQIPRKDQNQQCFSPSSNTYFHSLSVAPSPYVPSRDLNLWKEVTI